MPRLDRFRFSALDIKLGVRMLVKYPGLSAVSVIGMAVAIAIGAGAFSIFAAMLETRIPLPDGDRVVALRNAVLTQPGSHRATLRDFEVWRAALSSIQDVAAFTINQKTLAVAGTSPDLVRITRMSASGFTLARTAPILGRPLIEEDERSNARVVVIGYDEWQRRFAADRNVIGRTIGLGTESYTIVGVMPEGFRFPVDDHFWIPLAFSAAERAQDDAIALTIAGRLADGVTFERAQAEISGIGTRMAAAYPDTHAQLRARVISYPRAFFDMDSTQTVFSTYLFRLFLSLLLVVVAVNVAILVYARTATRIGEIAVRTALGASRARVVTQLFAEALVLSLAAAAVGLTIAAVGLDQLQQLAEQQMIERRFGALPFWIDLGLSPAVITYALALAVVGALIVGVLPALKATGRRVQANLQQLSGRAGTRMQLGRTWTALIVGQVAVAVAVLPFALHLTQEILRNLHAGSGYAIEEFLETSLVLERRDLPADTSAASQRVAEQLFRVRAAELLRRLESEPAIAGYAFRSRSYDRVEVEGIPSPGGDQQPLSAGTVAIRRVDPGLTALYDMRIVAGRALAESDVHVAGASAVLVNHVFAEQRLGNALGGRRLRIVDENASGEIVRGQWLDIVGVVRDFSDFETKVVYMPADIAQLSPPVTLVVRVHADPAMSFAPRFREIAAAVDPALQLDGLISGAEAQRQGQLFMRYLASGTIAVTLSVLLLSAAGIYAMMSFTVARRRREIGIRAALGANPRRVLSSVFARASAQIAAGVGLGVIGTVALDQIAGRGPVNDGNPGVLLIVAAVMTTVGLLAAIGPARSGLAVQPTEALRAE